MTIAFYRVTGIKLLSPQLSVLDPEPWRGVTADMEKCFLSACTKDIYCWGTGFEWEVYIVSLYNPY